MGYKFVFVVTQQHLYIVSLFVSVCRVGVLSPGCVLGVVSPGCANINVTSMYSPLQSQCDKHVLTTSISLGLASSNFSNDVSPELAKASDMVGPRMYKLMFHRIIIVYGMVVLVKKLHIVSCS